MDDESVALYRITHDSRAKRDRIDEKVMADLRIKEDMDNAPLYRTRLIYGKFETLLEM